MKTKNIISSIKTTLAYCAVVLGSVSLASCNKDFANRLPFDEEHQELNVEETQYKVAYVVLEGGVGTIVGREATDYGAMPTLGELSIHSISSWNGVSAENKEELTSYADLLTGVEYPKHQVSSSGDNNLSAYPTLFSRIQEQSATRTTFISANSVWTNLVSEADVSDYQLVGDDTQVTANAVDALAKEDVGVVVATFKEVDAVGQGEGYDSDAYIQALGHFDGQLREMVTTIRERENYANEHWLIVVASSKGGAYTLQPELDDGSVFSDTERNNFVVVHNPQFAYKLTERMQTVDPAWVSSAVRYTGDQGRAVMNATDADIYNVEKGKEYTIQLKVKVHSYGEWNQTLFSKRDNTNGGQDGWGIMIGRSGAAEHADASRGSFRFKVAGTEVYATDDIELETWYSVIVRVYVEDDKQYATLFRNGVEYSTNEITNAQGVSDQPLQLGYAPGYAFNLADQSHSIADVRIYDVAKSVEDIQNSYCTTLATPVSDAYYDNLIGYWPADDGGAEIRDRSGNNRHFLMEGNYSWNSFSERAATLCPTLPDYPERYVVRSVDVPRMIYNWLNFNGIEKFDLDAQIWNPSFTNN